MPHPELWTVGSCSSSIGRYPISDCATSFSLLHYLCSSISYLAIAILSIYFLYILAIDSTCSLSLPPSLLYSIRLFPAHPSFSIHTHMSRLWSLSFVDLPLPFSLSLRRSPSKQSLSSLSPRSSSSKKTHLPDVELTDFSSSQISTTPTL